MGLHIGELPLEGAQVVGEIMRAGDESIAAVAVGHQAVADVGLARQLRDLLRHRAHRILQLGDLVAHRAGGVDQKDQIEAHRCAQAGSQPHLHGLRLPTHQHGTALYAALAHGHTQRAFVVEAGRQKRARVQPHTAGGVGASPHHRLGDTGPLHRDLGIVHRVALRISHLEQVAFADVALAHRQVGVALAVGEVLAEVGVVVDHAGGDAFIGRSLRHRLRLRRAGPRRRFESRHGFVGRGGTGHARFRRGGCRCHRGGFAAFGQRIAR